MHNIDVILIKKSEIRNSKINSILNDIDRETTIPYLELPQDILAFPTISKDDVEKYFGADVKFVNVKTDYFGGSRSQSATLNITWLQSYVLKKDKRMERKLGD